MVDAIHTNCEPGSHEPPQDFCPHPHCRQVSVRATLLDHGGWVEVVYLCGRQHGWTVRYVAEAA